MKKPIDVSTDRTDILQAIDAERDYQNDRWGKDFDSRNTMNDWVAYITQYAGSAVTYTGDVDTFRSNLLKVAAICVAALEQPGFAPRHYD